MVKFEDILAPILFGVAFISVVAVICAAILSLHSQGALAADKPQHRVELTGCGHFLLLPKNECSYSVPKPNFNSLDAPLSFKSKDHRGAFWLGFSLPNYSECKGMARAKGSANAGRYPEIFQKYFRLDIDIGNGAFSRKNDEPFITAFHAGEGAFFFMQDAFGTSSACKILYDAAGPKGKIKNWVRIVN